ncbi:hypothetical protein LNKW23_07060 [Paralimibaculum aggregatum]|uniref:histidine kinase n=1 Tax=Paralimibaculum aggregatum TaxID=3036245 RepID=A0ABQ6LJU7_9RHOB|nr:ATP-binding protein [Limibaculum sp. NKW23]GMG81493.1 hypothetical protein LNKW23_07060 [Limibaculum sp. NKW23]
MPGASGSSTASSSSEPGAARPGIGLALALAIAALSITVILVLGDRVREGLAGLRAHHDDNTTWSMAQLSTDMLRLRIDARRAIDAGAADLDALRRRYDIFYSRVGILLEGNALDHVERAAERAAATELEAFRDALVPLMDGPDAALRAALPGIVERLDRLFVRARDLELAVLAAKAQASTEERESLISLLLWTGGAMLAVNAVLIATAGGIGFQSRRIARQSAELRQSAERMTASVASAIDAVLVADADGTIIEYNPAAERIFGFPRAEAIGQMIGELIIPPELRAAHRAGLARYLATGRSDLVGKGLHELSALNAAGERFPIELSIGRYSGERGPLFIAYIRDISERKRIEVERREAFERIASADRAKSDFLAVMSHEMRTPVAGVLTALDLVGREPLGPSGRANLERAKRSAEILLGHVSDVLDIAAIDSGKIQLSHRPFALGAMVAELADSLRGPAERRGNRLTVALDPSLPPWVASDERRIRQVLSNLIGNAIKFTTGGRIVVALDRIGEAEGRVRIGFSVTDTGIGIGKADLPKLFQDFVTLDAAYSREAGGTGLGLAVSRRIVRALGGEIGVESARGAGSRFWFRLALDPAEPAGNGEAVPPRQAHAGRRLLLVEDNEINRELAAQMLAEAGFAVALAEDGIIGLQKARQARFDLILMDVSMPRQDGIETTRLIRDPAQAAASRESPIIGITAHAQPEEIERFLAAGMDRCLLKPLRIPELLAAIEAVPDRPPGARRAEAGGADTGGADAREAIAGAPETAPSGTGAPDAGGADASAPDTAAPGSGVPDAGMPGTHLPEASAPVTGGSDNSEARAGPPVTGAAGTGTPKTGGADAGGAEAGAPDIAASGTGSSDNSEARAGPPGTGTASTGAPAPGGADASGAEAGAPDTAASGTGIPDTGRVESGAPDPGATRTGGPDNVGIETGTPDPGASGTCLPDASGVETGIPEVGATGTCAHDPGGAGAGTPDPDVSGTSPPDAGGVETGTPEAGASGAGIPDAGGAGAELAKAGATGTGGRVASVPGTGLPGAGATGSASSDAVGAGASLRAAGASRAGIPDAGGTGADLAKAGAIGTGGRDTRVPRTGFPGADATGTDSPEAGASGADLLEAGVTGTGGPDSGGGDIGAPEAGAKGTGVHEAGGAEPPAAAGEPSAAAARRSGEAAGDSMVGIDVPQALALLSGRSSGLVERVLAQFETEQDRRWQEIRQARARMDAPGVARAAHALCGTASAVGATGLAGLMGEVESAAKAGSLGACDRALAREAAARRVIAADLGHLRKALADIAGEP